MVCKFNHPIIIRMRDIREHDGTITVFCYKLMVKTFPFATYQLADFRCTKPNISRDVVTFLLIVYENVSCLETVIKRNSQFKIFSSKM